MKYHCNTIPFGLYNFVGYFWYQGKKKDLSEKESTGKNFSFISSGFSKFMLLTLMIVKISTELPFWECAVTFARFH